MQARFTKVIYILFLTLISIQCKVDAQPYYFRHYQVENGLSNNTVYFIRQDSDGFMWFATKDGLDRFDGIHFKVFRIKNSKKEKHLTTDYIYSLLPGKNGAMWVGAQQGLYQFNPDKGSLEPFIDSLDNIYDITMDRAGRLWFISGSTVCNYNFKTHLLQKFPPSDYFLATTLCLGEDGNIWAGTQKGFLKKYNPSNNSFITFDLFSHSKKPTSRWIQKIHSGDSNTIFVGTTSQGLKLFSITNASYEDVLTYNPDKTSIFVREILKNSPTEYWIATETGIFIYNTVTKTFTNLKKKFRDRYSLNDNAVYSLFKDAEGSLWVGTFFGGINYYAKQNAAFKKYFPDNNKNSISGNAVREICKDKYGNLWIGTEDGALNKINNATGRMEHFKPTGEKGSIAYTNIHGLLADGDNLWIGTFEHGIDVMDIRTGLITRHYSPGAGAKGLESNFALCFIRGSDGNIIFSTSNGLYYFDRKKNDFQRYKAVPLGLLITCVIEDHNKVIWAGTSNDGVFWIDPVTERHGHLQNETDKKNTLSNNSINDIYEDKNNNIWFATEGGGISKLDSARERFTFFTTANGLPGDFVYKILEDDDGKFWATTSNGLVNFGARFQNPIVYTKANGLLNNQFNYHSGYKDKHGRLYFGSVQGMISFMPADLVKSNFVPPVYITGLQVFNKEITPIKDSAVLKKSITRAQKITLKYNQSSISIDFSALSYISPEMTEYKYKLDGLDKDWTDIKTNRKVYFTNLSPGKYIFKIKAFANGQWSKDEKQLIIKINPPIWATGWAFLLYAIIVILIAYYIISNYQERLHEKKEKEIYESKIDFFTNVAHEIRTPLTLIKGPVENLLEKKDKMEDMREDMECLDRNTNRLENLVSQILDFRQTEIKRFTLDFTRVNVTEILKETSLSFNILTKKKNLDFQLMLPPSDLYALADAEALQKIFSNLISNAVKYAQKKVIVKFLPYRKNPESFMIVFENDGHLIKKEFAEKIFEPFYRIKETNHQKGTGIGLTLTKSLVELHNGTLEVSFIRNDLNIFVLTLPVQPEQNKQKMRSEKQPQT